jgi:histidinol-phosphatase
MILSGMTDLKTMLEVASEAAMLGGKRTLAYFNAGVTVETKADASPVTIADRESELAIRARIRASYPEHSILGEEGGFETGNPDFKWIIDPLDGTKTFVRGVPLYGVLVGLEIEGEVRVGAMYLPAMNEMIAAATGLGCHWNGRPARVSKTSTLEQSTILYTSSPSARARGSAFDLLVNQANVVRGWGDCYGYALVATGRADVMLDARMNPWDCAPLVPILEESGGRFTDWHGKRTIYGDDGFGTNGILHDTMLEVLKDAPKLGEKTS